MGKKRKNESNEDKILRKIRKLEKELKKRTRVISSDEESSKSSSDIENVSEVMTLLEPDMAVEVEHSDEPIPSTSSLEPIPSTSSLEPTPSTSSVEAIPGPSTSVADEIDEDVLLLLGEAPKPEQILGEEINKNIAERWQSILDKGLTKDIKQSLLANYLVPKNCEMLLAPTTNPEIKAGISEPTSKKDFSMMLTQRQISIALAALAQTTQEILKPLSDASKLLCDSFYYLTKARRNLIINTVNAEIKDTLRETTRDSFLFGTNLSEKLRNAKLIQRTGETIKSLTASRNYPQNKGFTPNRLNWKTPQRKLAGRPDAGRPRQAQRPVQAAPAPPRPAPAYMRPRSPPPPAPPRRYIRKN